MRLSNKGHEIGYSGYGHREVVSDDYADASIINRVASILSGGSGFDGSCSVSVAPYCGKSAYYFSASFHAIDDNGYYDGYAYFTFIVPILSGKEARVVFSGKESRNVLKRHYGLRDYIEGVCFEALEAI
jgi:hypothetical protein